MEDCGKYYYLDGSILPAVPGAEMPEGETSLYEVIRTYRGVPLFLDDHVDRLHKSISSRYDVPDGLAGEIKTGIMHLTASDPAEEINLRVTVIFTGHEYSLHICYIRSGYPDPVMYRDGARLILFNAERFDPGVKLLNMKMRISINAELERKNAYEALLVNKEGYVTEGSRSNVFFITRDNIVYTAPDKLVLQGITRKYVLEICRRKGVQLYFEPVNASIITSFESAFITGTSPMVLPVAKIDAASFNPSSNLIRDLLESYKELVEEYIRHWQSRK